MTAVSLVGLVKRYGHAVAVDGISLEVQTGEFISLLGPSGCGKTTTLKCLAGFEAIDQGRILFDGADVSALPPEQRDIGMVFQSYALFPHMTVFGNLAFGLEMRRMAPAEIAKRVHAVLELVQLDGFGARYPRELSGGQQQRVALARALVIEPKILLLDEPLANLDATLRNDMRTFIRDLQKRVGITTLYVTHDQAEAMTMSDRVVVMFGGRIAQADAPEQIYNAPANAQVAGFVGQANLFEGSTQTLADGTRVVACASGSLVGAAVSPWSEGALVSVMARPEAIAMEADTGAALAPGQMRGRVAARYFHGAFADFRVTVGAQDISVQALPGLPCKAGDPVLLRPDPARLWVIPPAGESLMQKLPRSLWLIAPAAAVIGLFLILPYLNIVVMSLRAPATSTPYGEGFSLASYAKFFADTYYIGAVLQTLWIGLLCTIVCFVLGFPVALQIVRASPRWRPVLYGIVLSPLLVGIVVRSYGWTILLGNNGVINRSLRDAGWIDAPLPLMYNTFGIVLALSHVFLPFMVLPVMGALQSVDPALENAARSLGASRRTVLRRIVLPLAMPGIQSGAILVFVLAVSAYVTPVLIGGMRIKTMAVIVVDTLIDQFQWPFGSALALMLSASAALVVVLFARLTRIRWK